MSSCRRAEDASDSKPSQQTADHQGHGASTSDTLKTPSSVQRAKVKALETEAFEMIGRLMKTFPERPAPMVLMGTVHARFGNGSEAQKCWEKSLEMDPRCAEAHAAIARFAQSTGRYEQAEARWKKAIEINPKTPGGRLGLARAMLGLGKGEQAALLLQEEIEADPGQAMSHCLLGKAYLELARFDKAKKHYQAAVALKSDFIRAYYGLSMACARLSQTDQARKYMETFRKLKSEERDNVVERKRRYDDVVAIEQLVALAYTQAGMFYKSNGYFLEAEQHWRKAADRDPRNPICRTMLGSLYAQNLRYAQALQMYEQLVKISPRNAAHHAGLGIVRVQLNQLDGALAALKCAVELDQDNPKYRKLYQEIRRMKGLVSGEGTR
ncbi:MAG: tetratricopeptide repeat protein [Phycisphaerae bacterium]|nr:tetratricopeptide repeat protein [Phycisphaerae bacterium]